MAAPAIGLSGFAGLWVLALMLVMIGSGRTLCRLLARTCLKAKQVRRNLPKESWRAAVDPFMAVVLGSVILCQALLLAELSVPGVHRQVVAGLGLFALPGLWRGAVSNRGTFAVFGVLIAVFTLTCFTFFAPRMVEFKTTGLFRFWVDMFVYAGTMAQFSTSDAIERGLPLLADVPAPLHHIASYVPAGLFVSFAGTSLLNATIMVWLLLGVMVMYNGLRYRLIVGGALLGTLSLAVMAVIPDLLLSVRPETP